MIGIDNTKILIVVREEEYGPEMNRMKKSLLEFVDWFDRVKARNAKIIPNGVNGCIVITENRYFTVDIL